MVHLAQIGEKRQCESAHRIKKHGPHLSQLTGFTSVRDNELHQHEKAIIFSLCVCVCMCVYVYMCVVLLFAPTNISWPMLKYYVFLHSW